MMDTIMPDIPRFYTALAESERVPCCDRESDDLFLDSVYGHCGNFDDRIYLWML